MRNPDADAREHRCIVDPQLEPFPGQQTTLSLEDHDDLADPGDDHVWGDDLSDQPAVRPRKLPWASLLLRTLGADGLACPRCQSQMVLFALITAPATVAKILVHLRIPGAPPPVAPVRLGVHQTNLLGDELDQSDPLDEPLRASAEHSLQAAVPRAPP